MKDRMVSVVMAAYNVEKYIGRCINSIINQTYSKIEVIIVDDGSKDKTAEVIEKFISEGKNIKLIRQANGGVSSARNNALKYASGDFICIFDSDDFMGSDHIETLISLYDKDENIDCAITGYSQYSNNKDSIIKNVESTEGIFEGRELAERLMFHTGNENLIAGVNNKLYSAHIIKNFDVKYDENLAYGEDWLFNIIYYMHCRKVSINNHVTSYYVHYKEPRLSTNFRQDGYLHSIYSIQILNTLFPNVFNMEKYGESILRITDYYNKYYVRTKGLSGFYDYCKNMVTTLHSRNYIPKGSNLDAKRIRRHKALIEGVWNRYFYLNLWFCSKEFLKYGISHYILRW